MESVEAKILNAAINLFSEKGYSATSIRDIANEVDLTSATLYHYMKNKKELLDLVMERYLNHLISGAEKVLQHIGNASAEEKLGELIKYHVKTHGNERLPALVVDTEYRSLEGESKQKIKAQRNKYEQIWKDILDEGKRQGQFHFQDLHITSFAIISLCTGVAHWYRSDGRLGLDEIAEQYAIYGQKIVQ